MKKTLTRKNPKEEVSLLEKMFAEIMPEVRLVDVTPRNKKVISKGNFKNQKLVRGKKK